MGSNFQEILYGMIHGLRDGIIGIVNIKKLAAIEETKDEEKSSEPQSVLASRRAEKNRRKGTPEKKKKPEVMQKIILCCTWNGGVSLMSIVIFNMIILPCLQWFIQMIFGNSGTHNLVWSWIGPVLSWTFSALWVLPLFFISKIVNTFWYQDIADAAYLHSRGRPRPLNISVFTADITFSVVLQIFFLIQATLCLFVPLPGVAEVLSSFHMSLLYSLYAFEYKWLNMGLEVHQRLQRVENHWPYFCGFGLPLAVLTSLHPSIFISGCIFSLLFPLFIISANEASEPKLRCSFPLKLFAVVTSLSNTLFSAFTSRHSHTSKVVPPKSTKRVGIADKVDIR